MSEPIEIRPYRPGDEQSILCCYNRVFPDKAAGVPERSMEHWAWKFLHNPTGRMLHMLGVHQAEGVVGIYAGIPVRIWSEGRVQLAAQGVDFCVLPEWRRWGDGPGLYVALGRAYIDTWHGSADGEVLFTYGWPVPAWRSGQRHLGFINIRDWDSTFREMAPGDAPRATPSDLATREVPRFGDEVDELFDALKPTLGLALIRDQTYLNWRYADRPDRDYRLYECRETRIGRLRGIAVYGVGDLIRPNTGFIVDWLHHAGDEDAMCSMLGAMERQVLADGVGMLGSVWNHVDPRFLEMQRAGYLVRGTRYFLVLATAKYDTFFFRDNWYFTMGDSDLV